MRTDIKRRSNAMYDAWQRFSERRIALALLLVWAMAEATVWPILAEFVLVPLVLVRRTRPWTLAGACIAGMAVGGIVTVLVARSSPDFALELLRELPLVTGDHLESAARQLADHGVAGFLIQPWSGIPFKAWAVMAGQQGLAPWLVIPTFVAARATRMVLTAGIAHLLGRALGRRLRDWFAVVVALYLVLFATGFVAVVL